MAQFNWTYVSDTGRRHVVGLFHGDHTGHLLVHCNSRIVLIDFHVLDSKDYSFFIDEELFELKLKREKNTFYYDFDINKETDTPKNRERKRTEKKHLRQTLILLGAMAVFVALVFFGLRYRNRSQLSDNRQVLLEKQPAETVARVAFDEHDRAPLTVKYSYIADGQIYEGSFRLNSTMLNTGMELEPGDEFLLRYASQHPKVHEIKLNEPSEQQIRRYRQRAYQQHAQLHPTLSDHRINCVLDVVYEAKGVNGYADIIFQDTSPDDNRRHNRNTYENLIREEKVADRLATRCTTEQ